MLRAGDRPERVLSRFLTRMVLPRRHSDATVALNTVAGAIWPYLVRHGQISFRTRNSTMPARRRVDCHPWSRRIHLNWGLLRARTGWVFPKGDWLTVGVIAARGAGTATRAYLTELVAGLGLDQLPVLRSSGRLAQCRRDGSPLRRGRVLVAGDGRGCWSRGHGRASPSRCAPVISPAVPPPRCPTYLAIAHTPPGWKAFQDFTRGTAMMPELVGRWPITTSIKTAKTASRLVRAPAIPD
jgi:hypothetical protein